MFLRYPQLPASPPPHLSLRRLSLSLCAAMPQRCSLHIPDQIGCRFESGSNMCTKAAGCGQNVVVLGVTIRLYTRPSCPLYLPHTETGTAYFRDSYRSSIPRLVDHLSPRQGGKKGHYCTFNNGIWCLSQSCFRITPRPSLRPVCHGLCPS